MPDPAALPAAPRAVAAAAPPQKTMHLVDRCVRVVDELEVAIQESEAGELDPRIMAIVNNDYPEATSLQEAEAKRQAAFGALLRQYREEVEIPAFRSLKASKRCSRPGDAAVLKEPVTGFPPGASSYYCELLDGIELDLPQLAAPPSATSLTLRISWPPDHPISPQAFIAGCDESILVLCVGTYRPGGHSEPGFYLVYNSSANSIAIVPPLLSCSSHSNISLGVAVLNILHPSSSGCYLVAELLRRRRSQSHLSSNNNAATLFMWWSPGSGPLAGRWTQEEVVLPLPAADESSFPFCADMVFSAAGTSLCWVDLVTGILVCPHVDRLRLAARASKEDDDARRPVFHFIPLPPECATKRTGRHSRGQPGEYRSMCPMDNGETIKFVSIVGFSENRPTNELVLRTWTLKNPLSMESFKWEDSTVSFCIRDLWGDPIYKDGLRLQPLTPSFPVLCTQRRDVVYLSVTDDYGYKLGHMGLELARPTTGGFYRLSLNMRTGRLISAIKVPSHRVGILPPRIFTSHFGSYLGKTRESEVMNLGCVPFEKSIQGKELADEGEPWHHQCLFCEDGGGIPCTTSSVPTRSMPYTAEQCFATWRFCRDGLGGRQVISSPCPAGLRLASSFRPTGLPLALDAGREASDHCVRRPHPVKIW